jgi:D-serine deaminase-like pyridoxal phosphate-dependent protein
LRIDEIPTPALVIDRSVLESNIEGMAAYFADRKANLRPHFKAHKCIEIAKLQLQQPATIGLTCATVRELELLADAGFDDVLLANELATPDKMERVAKVAREITVTVAVDSERQVAMLDSACERIGSTCGVLVDINVGMPRCGVQPTDAPRLAKLVDKAPRLRFEGLMGYEGHCVLIEDRQTRRDAAVRAVERLLEARDAVESEGIEVSTLSAGGTGTYDITSNMDGITEIQAGSYVLMDDAYAKLELGFERGLFLLCSVISKSSPVLAVADGGLKALSTDHGMPSVVEAPDAKVLFLSDEHATIQTGGGSAALEEGSKIHLSVTHIDPTINMHDEIWVLRDGEVVDIWPVSARGYGTHDRMASAKSDPTGG